MSNRNPKVEELEKLYALVESEGFKYYQQILTEIHAQGFIQLNRVLCTPDQIAAHNRHVGMMDGIVKARDEIRDKIKELERDIAQEEAIAEYKTQRKVQHQ